MIISSCICQNKSFFKPVIKYSLKEKIFKDFRGAIIGECLNCKVLKTVIKPKLFNPKISHIDVYQNKKEEFIEIFLPVVNEIKKLVVDGSILDVGCGTGILLTLLKKAGYQVCGIEPNLKAYQISKKKLPHKIFLGTADKFFKKNPNKKFNIVIYNHVLEHIENFNEEFTFMKKFLRKNGFLVIGTPNINNVIFKLRKKYWEGLRTNEHIWHFSENYLINYLKKNGFKIKKVTFNNDKRRDYPLLKQLYFNLLNLINKLLNTGEAVTIYAQKI
ncbi:MAG: class I SAM-dependent methyltransferase [Patescibacteria group bacterium]|nr:class I SAM-dependent methyltransferase [Patescibacteria group bacterium]